MKRLVVLLTILVCSMFLLFRFWLAVNAKHGDMYNNLDWGQIALDHGFTNFYELPKETWPHSVANQPAGSIYLHTASVSISQSLDTIFRRLNTSIPIFPSPLIWWWEWNGSLVSIKFYSILADFVISFVILALARRFRRPKLGIILALAYLVNPALWYNSSFWGQTDPVVAALASLSLLFLFRSQPRASAVFLGLSFMTKASWAPILPLYLFYFWKQFPASRKSLLLIPLVVLIGFIPFHPEPSLPFWLKNLYLERILPGESAYITVLAFNFWNLIFGPYAIPHTTPFFGIPANIVGWSIVGVITLYLLYRLAKNLSSRNFLWCASLLFFAVFLFAPKMIHRYLYPVFPLLHLTLLTLSKRLLVVISLAVISALYITNIYYRWWAPGIEALVNLFTPSLINFISLAYLAVFGVLFVRYHLHVKV